MSGGGIVHPHGLYSGRGGRLIAAPTCTSVRDTNHPHGLYSERSGRQIAAPTGVIPFIHTGYNCNVPGTAHRPFPTVSLMCPPFNPGVPKRPVRRGNNGSQKLSIVNCPLSIPVKTVHCPLSTLFNCQFFCRCVKNPGAHTSANRAVGPGDLTYLYSVFRRLFYGQEISMIRSMVSWRVLHWAVSAAR